MIIDLAQTDLLLAVGVLFAVIAIGCGLRGAHSIAAKSRQEKANQSTTTLPLPTRRRKEPSSGSPTKKSSKAA